MKSPWTEEQLARLRSWFVRERKGTKKKMDSRYTLEARLRQQKRERDDLVNTRRAEVRLTEKGVEQVVAAIPDMPGWRDSKRKELHDRIAVEDAKGRAMFEARLAEAESIIAKLEAQLAALPPEAEPVEL